MNEAKRPNLIGEWRYMYGRIITMGLTPAHWSFWECVFYHMNDSRWQPWVTITTDTLLQRTQVSSRKVLYRLRRELEAAGLLAYRRGNRGCSGEYRVIMQEFSNRWFNTEVTENAPECILHFRDGHTERALCEELSVGDEKYYLYKIELHFGGSYYICSEPSQF